jgi:branched-chain amino acid transport system permease protein
MGINTTHMKLLAFAMGATFGGVAGGMFSAIQGFISPESFVLVESVMVVSMVVLGGMGNIWGVILGALLLSSCRRSCAGRSSLRSMRSSAGCSSNRK